MSILAEIQPVDLIVAKSVFISAIRFATSIDGPCPPFGDELRVSAQEQVEYMLGDDKDMPFVAVDNEVKSETIIGLSHIFSLFERELSLLLESTMCKLTEDKIVRPLSDLEWMCGILLKMDLMNDFVSKWIDVSESVLHIVEDGKIECIMWGLKMKLLEVTSKVLDVVGYGNVILPSLRRVKLLKSWFPFVRKLKPVMDSMMGDEDSNYKMDEDVWQSIEGSMVSLVSTLPSNDQADILVEWMNDEQQLRYPDLSEAFEVWCFRTKSAKRRLVVALDY